MQHALILAQSEFSRDALRAVAALRLGEEADDIPAKLTNVAGEVQASDAFCEVSGWIEGHLGDVRIPQDECVILVDTVRPADLNPIGSDTWNAAIAMLILAFPEVRWIFGVSCGLQDDDSWEPIGQWHGLEAFLGGVLGNPLFDGTGLRDWVRERAKATGLGSDAAYIPMRPEWAAAIDDEATYAYFNAYICYRFGFRAWAVNSDRLFHKIFDEPNSKPAALTLEDMYLGFADRSNEHHYSNLKERGECSAKGLKKVGRRYFVTTGHHRGAVIGPQDISNAAVLRELQVTDRGGIVVLKPIPGIFALWEKTELIDKLAAFDEDGHQQRGHAPGYIWPPARLVDHAGDNQSRHSAPGRLLQVAEHLIARAERHIAGVSNVPEAVRGAVMASIAQELLGDRTPTTARDALELKHRFEVIAECQFGGVELGIDLTPRFDEIKREMYTLGEWFSPMRRGASELNGELILVSRLLTIFRDNDQLDAAEKCRRTIRDLHRATWARRLGYRAIPIWPFRIYIEKLVGSMPLLFGAILGWIAVFFFAFLNNDPELGWAKSLSLSVNSFVGGSPFMPENKDVGVAYKVTVSVVSVLWGYLHIGLLISNLYRIVSRA